MSVDSYMNSGEGRLAQSGESRCSQGQFVADAHAHLSSHRIRQSGVPPAKKSTRPQVSTARAASTAGFMGSVVRRNGLPARRPKARRQPHGSDVCVRGTDPFRVREVRLALCPMSSQGDSATTAMRMAERRTAAAIVTEGTGPTGSRRQVEDDLWLSRL